MKDKSISEVIEEAQQSVARALAVAAVYPDAVLGSLPGFRGQVWIANVSADELENLTIGAEDGGEYVYPYARLPFRGSYVAVFPRAAIDREPQLPLVLDRFRVEEPAAFRKLLHCMLPKKEG